MNLIKQLGDTMSYTSIVAVGAHPDDFELGAAGTLKKFLNQGHKVYGVVVTKGNRGGHPEDYSECCASAEYLNLTDLIFLDFEDTAVERTGSTVTAIENVIKKINPASVFTHTPNDRHQDHHYTALAAQSAARKVDNIYLFETPSTTYHFIPHAFSDIEDTLENKIEALKRYQSQVQKGIIDIDTVIGKARYHGHNNNMRYAEAFEVNHMRLI
mgnify:CR=1 FL=1